MRVPGRLAAVLPLVLLLAGCGSQAPQPTYSPTITVAPSGGTAVSTPSAAPDGPDASSAAPDGPDASPGAPTRSTEPTEDAAAPAGQCPDDALGVGVRSAADGGEAGSRNLEVLFTNTGGSPCRLAGAPSVAVVAADTARIGPPADRTGGERAVTLDVGQTVVAPLRVTNIGTDGGPLGSACSVRKGAGYRVSAPHSRQRFTVEDGDAVACADGPVFMTVGPVARQPR